ncbi:MAG: MarR family winged helix-turn-helix transcriptional regulator [Thermaerobacter sp.]|nr:MarR family winged helix-turn-helix transcriptional regulator [Thermaerobacter sp.]
MSILSSEPYRFGDLLALARAGWVAQMADALEAQGYPGYRRTDAWAMRLLASGPVPITQVGMRFGISRQGGRKVVDGLMARGYAATDPDATDRRRVNVSLTPVGAAYADAVLAVIRELNGSLAALEEPRDLEAADRVLRAAMDERARQTAQCLVRPPSSPTPPGSRLPRR